MDYRALITNLDEAPQMLRRLVGGVSLGRVRLDADDDEDWEWTEEDQIWWDQLEEDRRRREERYAMFDEEHQKSVRKHEAFMELYEKFTDLRGRMHDLVKRMKSLQWWLRDMTADEILSRLSDLGEETIEIFGGCFESYSECDMPVGFTEMWNEMQFRSVEEWWAEEYLPACNQLRKRVGRWEEENGELDLEVE